MLEPLKRAITGTILLSLLGSIYYYLPAFYFSLLLITIVLIIIMVEWPRLFSIDSKTFWLLMPLYPITPFIIMIWLNQHYHALIFWLFLIVFNHDCFSYLVGKPFGKHKICPSISPGKSWEGFIGGVASTCLIVYLLTYNQPFDTFLRLKLFAFVILTCSVALLGDFFKSIFKRRVHIKDTGSLLPGHGGLLDRFDGIMFASLLFFLFRNWLIKIV